MNEQHSKKANRATVHFDPTDASLIENPHRVFAEFRQRSPVVWNDAGFWIATGYDAVRSVIIDKRNFGQGDFIRNIQLYYGAEFDVFAHSAYRWLSEVFVYQDPPRHTRIRGLVSQALTVKRVREMRPDIETITHGLLDRVSDQRNMELIHDFAYRLPTLVMCNMLGIGADEADEALLARLNQAIADSFLVLEMRPLTAAELELANRQTDFLESFFGEIFERRRKHPRDDLATALLHARDGDSQLTEREMITVAIALFGAGFETTAHMIGNGVLVLRQNPQEWQKLVATPELATRATEEILRYESSLIATYRTAFNDIEVGGQTIQAGERVLAVLAAANRDPEIFSQPDTFTVEREGPHHLAFGGGIHFCVGAELARLEGEIALRALATRMPALELAGSTPQWRPGFMFRGLSELRVRW
jgi:hypothetical protein|tara:strand:+ start:29128 stop:30384 length:1257 start_codon:yes stop_codon:yes gene_type:complete